MNFGHELTKRSNVRRQLLLRGSCKAAVSKTSRYIQVQRDFLNFGGETHASAPHGTPPKPTQNQCATRQQQPSLINAYSSHCTESLPFKHCSRSIISQEGLSVVEILRFFSTSQSRSDWVEVNGQQKYIRRRNTKHYILTTCAQI